MWEHRVILYWEDDTESPSAWHMWLIREAMWGNLALHVSQTFSNWWQQTGEFPSPLSISLRTYLILVCGLKPKMVLWSLKESFKDIINSKFPSVLLIIYISRPFPCACTWCRGVCHGAGPPGHRRNCCPRRGSVLFWVWPLVEVCYSPLPAVLFLCNFFLDLS